MAIPNSFDSFNFRELLATDLATEPAEVAAPQDPPAAEPEAQVEPASLPEPAVPPQRLDRKPRNSRGVGTHFPVCCSLANAVAERADPEHLRTVARVRFRRAVQALGRHRQASDVCLAAWVTGNPTNRGNWAKTADARFTTGDYCPVSTVALMVVGLTGIDDPAAPGCPQVVSALLPVELVKRRLVVGRWVAAVRSLTGWAARTRGYQASYGDSLFFPAAETAYYHSALALGHQLVAVLSRTTRGGALFRWAAPKAFVVLEEPGPDGGPVVKTVRLGAYGRSARVTADSVAVSFDHLGYGVDVAGKIPRAVPQTCPWFLVDGPVSGGWTGDWGDVRVNSY